MAVDWGCPRSLLLAVVVLLLLLLLPAPLLAAFSREPPRNSLCMLFTRFAMH